METLKTIMLTRKNTTEAANAFKESMKEIYKNGEAANIQMVKSDKDDRILEPSILVPNVARFSKFFTKLKKCDPMQADFEFNDSELEAQVGLCNMQVAFSGGAQKFLMIEPKGNKIIFALVGKAFYEQNSK